MANAIKDYLSAQWWAIADCADAYESQCGSDFPDLRSFSGRLAPADRAAGLAELVKIELERRWKSGSKKQIEDYLRDFPELKDPSVSLDDLVAQEYLVRSRYGNPPTVDELQSRFPSVDVGKVLPPGQGLLGTVALGDAKIETRRSVSDDNQPGTDGTIVYDTQKSKSSGGSTVGESHSAGAASGSAPVASGSASAASKSAPATPAQPAAALTGSIGRYAIRQQLGAGSFGVVLRCTDEDLKRDVAIKLPHRTGASSAERVKEFLHEAQSAARLRHPGIVTVLNTGLSDDGRVYIVYEFIRGKTLQSRLDEGDYTLQDVVRWVAGTAEALHHAHKNAIVHRDIKPANILLDEDSQPHIADFGLAKMDDHFFKNDAGRVLGTAAYMSPEQANGQSHWASPQTDIYSVGVMLYQMLTKRLPFGGRTLSEMLEQVKDRVPSPPRTIDDKIPKPLEDVCLRAMAKNPADRYSTAADMAADLRAALGGAPPSRRGRWLVGILSGAAAIGGVALMLIWGRGHDDRTKPPDGSHTVVPATPQVITITGLEPTIPVEPSTPILEVVYQPYTAQGVYHSLRIKDVLHWKDKVKFHVTVGVPRYVYLFWYDVDGKSTPVWPTDFAHQEKTKQVDFPPKGEWEEIDNQHGAEFLLVAARDKPLEGDELAQFEKQLPYAKNDIRVDAVYPVGSKDLSRGLAGIVKSREDPLEPDFKNTLDQTFASYHGLVIPHQ